MGGMGGEGWEGGRTAGVDEVESDALWAVDAEVVRRR